MKTYHRQLSTEQKVSEAIPRDYSIFEIRMIMNAFVTITGYAGIKYFENYATNVDIEYIPFNVRFHKNIDRAIVKTYDKLLDTRHHCVLCGVSNSKYTGHVRWMCPRAEKIGDELMHFSPFD